MNNSNDLYIYIIAKYFLSPMMDSRDNDEDHLPVTIIHETTAAKPESRLDHVSNKNQVHLNKLRLHRYSIKR